MRIPGDTELERLVARSRLIGADPELVVHGGGNTSSKLVGADHLGRERPVMRIKGSGTDLATIGPDGFPGLYLDELAPLRARDAMTDEAMVDHLARCMTEPGSRAPSIETLLHAFLPAPQVDHVHADAICALTNHPEGRAAVREALGDEVAFVEYVRPGFELSRRCGELAGARGIVLEHHGLVTWGETGEASYERTLELVAAAREYLARLGAPAPEHEAPALPDVEVTALLAALREALGSRGRPVVLHVDRAQRALTDRPDVEALAAVRGTPDHMLRIGTRTAVVRSAGEVAAVVDAFAADYAAYEARHAAGLPPGSPARDPLPGVVLVPGLGCVAAGPSASAARMAAGIARRSHVVTGLALDAFGAVEWLDEAEVFAFDHWPLELRKLAAAPPPAPLAGMVVGAPGPSGDVAAGLAAAGAEVLTGTEAEVARAAAGQGGLDALVALGATSEPVAAPVVVAVGPDAALAAGARRSVAVVCPRVDDPAVVAALVFLLSPAAAGTDGSVLRIGGGGR